MDESEHSIEDVTRDPCKELSPEKADAGEHQLESSHLLTDAGEESPQELIIDGVTYQPYLSELQMPSIVQLMKASLSEPYSIYTYRYFIHKWPQLCKLATSNGRCVGAVVCKLEPHHFNVRRGYIAMLAVAEDFRRKKIGQLRVISATLLNTRSISSLSFTPSCLCLCFRIAAS